HQHLIEGVHLKHVGFVRRSLHGYHGNRYQKLCKSRCVAPDCASRTGARGSAPGVCHWSATLVPAPPPRARTEESPMSSRLKTPTQSSRAKSSAREDSARAQARARLTITDIAHLAGVSKKTVSRVINKAPYVN